jgi:hypothetical protein
MPFGLYLAIAYLRGDWNSSNAAAGIEPCKNARSGLHDGAACVPTLRGHWGHPMLTLIVALIMMWLQEDLQPLATGAITGVVVNGTQSDQPLAHAEVHLRAGTNGLFEPVGTCTTDSDGRFAFRDLPLDASIVYLPGANRDGVHYPGQRVQLTSREPLADVRIVAFDAIHIDSPLVAERHEIDVSVGERMLEIRETLAVANRSRATYVGQPDDELSTVTLQLSIPPNFDRVTFDREFFGRRFRIVDHRVVTDVPWPPGDYELKFTYRVPLEESAGLFRRPMDLPTSHLSIRVRANDLRSVSCNLTSAAQNGNQATFVADEQLPAGYAVELQIGQGPFPWLLVARWVSLGLLAALVLAAIYVRRRARLARRTDSADPAPTLPKRLKRRQRTSSRRAA